MPVSTIVPAMASMLAMAGAPSHPGAELALALHDNGGHAGTVNLECHPSGGTHPGRGKACRSLTLAGGDFDRLPREAGMCPLIWAPVTATATGRWQAKPVLWTHTYPNSCVAARESGGVFDF